MQVQSGLDITEENESEIGATADEFLSVACDRFLPFTVWNSRLSVGLSVALLAETALRTFTRSKEDAQRLRRCALRYHEMAADRLRDPHLFTEQQQRDLRAKLDRLAAALSRLDGSREKDPPDALEGLTPREIEVLKYIAEGNSTKEVAGKMGIRFKTAVCHRYKLMEKLNIHDTASLVRFAIRHGVVQV